MMATLIDWYPGDRALDFVLIVAFGVALLSGAAWIVSWRLPRKPAARHLVLVSAMICCLAMPALASVVTASGWTLIAIPLLPANPAERDWDSARVMAVDARTLLGASPFDPAGWRVAGGGREGRKTEDPFPPPTTRHPPPLPGG